MSPVRSIQTRFAGCHFRSRLEARWAVAFDELGIEWEYEAQGVVVENRLGLPDLPESWNYLPDFWLPDLQLWAEVKGELPRAEYRKLLCAAAYLSSPTGGCGGGHDVVILGPIPRPKPRCAVPVRLHMHKGDLKEGLWTFEPAAPPCYSDRVLASDEGTPGGEVLRGDGYSLLHGWKVQAPEPVLAAYTAARSARFEYGQKGAARSQPQEAATP